MTQKRQGPEAPAGAFQKVIGSIIKSTDLYTSEDLKCRDIFRLIYMKDAW